MRESKGAPQASRASEDDEPFAQRVRDVLQAIVEGQGGGAIAIVTHRGVIGSVLRQTLDLPVSRRGPFAIDNASVTMVDVQGAEEPGARPRIQLTWLNDTCHLDGLRR